MTPRGWAVAGGVAAVGAAAAVVTAVGSGWVPDPFAPPDSGRQVSTAPEERPPIDPFRPDEPKLPVVESGSKAAARLGETVIPPTKDVDVVESGTPKAEALGEMLPLDPIPDPFRDIDARRAREQAFAADSRFPANPLQDQGRWRFDLRVEHRVLTRDVLASFVYHLNSRDGSWVVEGDDIRHLVSEADLRGAKLSFILRQAGGDLLACGSHPALAKAPRACVKLGMGLLPLHLRAFDQARLAEWMDSVRRVPQTLAAGPGGGAVGQRGKVTIDGRSQHLQLWLAPGDSGVRTRVPWLGMGSGVLKDARVQLNRRVNRVVVEGADLGGGDIVIDGVSLQRAEHEVDTRNFHVVTAFTAAGVQEAVMLGLQLTDLKARAIELETKRQSCAQGNAGRECRAWVREQMKALNEHARQQAQSFGDRHGLPTGR